MFLFRVQYKCWGLLIIEQLWIIERILCFHCWFCFGCSEHRHTHTHTRTHTHTWTHTHTHTHTHTYTQAFTLLEWTPLTSIICKLIRSLQRSQRIWTKLSITFSELCKLTGTPPLFSLHALWVSSLLIHKYACDSHFIHLTQNKPLYIEYIRYIADPYMHEL